jgi:hypothetical protein
MTAAEAEALVLALAWRRVWKARTPYSAATRHVLIVALDAVAREREGKP